MLEGRIHRAEAEAIALAAEIGARWLLMDDRRAVEQARGMGLSILRTPMILALAARSGTVPDLRRCLEQMREAGF
jgi:predicted nucleic acid-binding protein